MALNIKHLSDRLHEAARRQRFQVGYIAHVGELGVPLFTRGANEEKPSMYISAGIHGDEPAGPMALLELFRKGLFTDDLNYYILPILNPFGLQQGTRENEAGIDLNRDFGQNPVAEFTRKHMEWLGDRRFDMTVCLHEDSDAKGFYVYELRKDPSANPLGPKILAAAEPFTGIDRSPEIDGMPAVEGLMNPPATALGIDRADAPEALRLFFNHTDNSYTLETPSSHSILNRIQALVASTLALSIELAKSVP
jgi:hypothetical protein